MSWGNIVFDIVSGPEFNDLTIGEICILKECIYSLSTTGYLAGFARSRVAEPSDEWYHVEIYSFKIPRYPFTLKLINETVEWTQDPYDGDGVVIRNGKLIPFHSKPGHTIGKGTYRYEQHHLTQIK